MGSFEKFCNHLAGINRNLEASLEKHRSPLCFYSMFFSHINHDIERCPSFVARETANVSTANPL